MKTLDVKIKLYSFDELPEDAKNKARINHIEFLGEISNNYFDNEGNVKPEFEGYFVVDVIEEMERLQTPWFFNETMFHEHKNEIDEEIKINEYLFFESGELANCTTYTGKHEKSGITEFHYCGQTYVLN
jgi:hypothetical protein